MHESVDPMPALLHLGEDDSADVYVDIEPAGYTAVAGEAAAVDDLLTGEENLRLMARLHHLPREQVRPFLRASEQASARAR